jgi:hypothetical protein
MVGTGKRRRKPAYEQMLRVHDRVTFSPRFVPPNNTPHPDARANVVPCGGSSARAGGRGRWVAGEREAQNGTGRSSNACEVVNVP